MGILIGIPANAGIMFKAWTPAFAGVTSFFDYHPCAKGDSFYVFLFSK